MSSGVLKQGFLEKHGRTWTRVFCVLYKERLTFSNKPGEATKSSLNFDVGTTVEEVGESKHGFEFSVGSEAVSWLLSASTQEERMEWLNALREMCMQPHSQSAGEEKHESTVSTPVVESMFA